MFLVDTQVHIWKDETPDRPWIAGARERMKKNGHRTEAFSYEECLEMMDEAGVDRVIIVPPSWEGDRIDYALDFWHRGDRDELLALDALARTRLRRREPKTGFV